MNTWHHNKLLLNRNSYLKTCIVYILLVLDRNTCYHITVQIIIRQLLDFIIVYQELLLLVTWNYMIAYKNNQINKN